MNYKYITIGVFVLVLAGSVGVMMALKNKSPESANPNPPVSQSEDMKGQNQTTNPVSDKRGIKRFTLEASGSAKVEGDGSITLKDKLTSMAVRLTEASEPTGTNQYEVYIVSSEGSDPVFAGTLQSFNNPNAKFLWGGAGEVSWFDAEKVIITRRSSSQAKPGTIVAEGKIPAQAEPAK